MRCVRFISFAQRKGMLRPKYALLLWRYLWRRLLTPAGWRWQTRGPVFFGRGVRLKIEPGATVRFGAFSWIGDGTKIRCHEGVVEIGDKTVLGQECTISAYRSIRIGPECVVADRAMFIDFDHNVADVELAVRRQGIYMRDVRVGANVWVGYGACVLRGVEVGDNAILGTYAVATKHVPANAVVAGIPAEVVRMRDTPASLGWPEPLDPERPERAGPR